MKIKTLTLTLLVATSAVLWTGCGKGPVGPMGPAGYDGKDANVISSPWITPASNAWTYDNVTKEYYYDIADNEITQDIVENGVVLAYMTSPDDIPTNSVRPLPAYAMGCDWTFLIHSYGSIEITSNAIANPGNVDISFRYILIPATIYLKSTKLKSKSIVELKNMPYEEVCSMFGIKQ